MRLRPLFLLLLTLTLAGSARAEPMTVLNSAEYDADDYGCIGDGLTDDTACLQAVIDAAVADGGGVVRFSRHYAISSALTVKAKNSQVRVWIRGDGARTSQIRQTTADADVLVVGKQSCECADEFKVSDLSLKGGRYGLRLNNALNGVFRNLEIDGSTIGIYLEGQNERHRFEGVAISGASRHGILAGVSNGTCADPLDHPELQKTIFDHVRIAGTTEGPAFRITAGLCKGVQQVSGDITVRHLLLEGNKRGGLYVSHTGLGLAISRMSTEDQPDRDATYAALDIETGSNIVYLDDSVLANNASTPHRYKHFVRHVSGQLFIDGLTTGGSPATHGDVWVADGASVANSVLVGGSTSGLRIDREGADGKLTVSGLRDSSGTIILGGSTATPLACRAEYAGLNYFDTRRHMLCYCDNATGEYRWCPLTDMRRCRYGSSQDCGMPRWAKRLQRRS